MALTNGMRNWQQQMKLRPIAATLALLFGPAVVSAVSRRAGLVTAACSVAILVYVILKNERISR